MCSAHRWDFPGYVAFNSGYKYVKWNVFKMAWEREDTEKWDINLKSEEFSYGREIRNIL